MIDPRDPRLRRVLPGYGAPQRFDGAPAPRDPGDPPPGGGPPPNPTPPANPGPPPNPTPPVPGGPGPLPPGRLPTDPGVIIPGATPGQTPGGTARPEVAPPTEGYYGNDYAWRQATGQSQWYASPPAGGRPPTPRGPVDPNDPGGPGPRPPVDPGGPPVGTPGVLPGQRGPAPTPGAQSGDVGNFAMTASPGTQPVPMAGGVGQLPAAPQLAAPVVAQSQPVPPQIAAERAQRRAQPVEQQSYVAPPAAPAAPVQRAVATGVQTPTAQPAPFQPTAQAPVIAAPQPGRIPNGNVGY